MTIKKNVLIMKFSNISNQPRIYRQIEFLKDKYNIYTAAFNFPPNYSIKKHFNIKIPFLPTGLIDKLLWNLKAAIFVLSYFFKLDQTHYNLIIAHDPFTLRAAITLSKKIKAKVIHDAHEYTPGQYEDQWFHKLFLIKIWHCICKKHMHRADVNIAVCQGIANEYQKNYGVHCEVINNASFYSNLSPTSVSNNTIRMIHHGAALPSRHTEEMINLMSLLDKRFHLDFMLLNNGSRYYKKIVQLADKNPRISFRDTVPMPEIPQNTNNYDIGLFLLSPETFSYRMALPNKFFEFIQARLAIAIWPSPEMARLVRQYNCGIVSDDFSIESMAEKLNALSQEDIMEFKMNSHKAAGQLCAEKNKDKFLSIVERLIGS